MHSALFVPQYIQIFLKILYTCQSIMAIFVSLQNILRATKQSTIIKQCTQRFACFFLNFFQAQFHSMDFSKIDTILSRFRLVTIKIDTIGNKQYTKVKTNHV